MGQVQCPNCGGYKVTTSSTVIDSDTGRSAGCGTLFVLLIGGILALWLLANGITGLGASLYSAFAISGDPIYRRDLQLYGMLAGFGVLSLIGTVIGFFVIRYVIRNVKGIIGADKITQYSHECSLCGYRWTRRSDERPPSVTVRPDLIQKGEQKLEQERRDAQDAFFFEQERQKRSRG